MKHKSKHILFVFYVQYVSHPLLHTQLLTQFVLTFYGKSQFKYLMGNVFSQKVVFVKLFDILQYFILKTTRGVMATSLSALYILQCYEWLNKTRAVVLNRMSVGGGGQGWGEC